MALVDKPVVPKRRSVQSRAKRVEAAALVVPALIPILIFSVAPLLSGIGLAFTDASLRRNDTPDFVGLQNFVDLLGDTMFWESFRIGMVWAVSVTVLQLVAGLVLALLLNANLRFQGLARVLALIPWAMPPVVVAIMWQLIYATNGPLNAVLSVFGPDVTTNWLGEFSTALPAVIVVGVWVGMPQTTITLLAALQQIPTEQIEAAAMDGAGAVRRFFNVSLPAIRPVMASITSLNFIWNFNSFGLVYVMTEGGPGGKTMLPMLFTYLEAFKSRNLGYASAMGCVLVLIVVALLAIYLWSQFREKEAK
ncbi:sugar ABC transporter permease [Propioniciclava coleopterorum]|uniref:Sugar ABC transporter permease n=1 Tax=Propioniciclava coleopterorum TaxID=2714937 RepID=A0A6G7YB56_9ACTN|nr:sugar ABC transporter permease [Propioniciclava coleopterorum]